MNFSSMNKRCCILNKEDIKKYWEFLDQDEVDVRAFTPGETELDKKYQKEVDGLKVKRIS